jgi:hypothetical protein
MDPHVLLETIGELCDERDWEAALKTVEELKALLELLQDKGT